MPIGAPELAVGNRRQPDLLLLSDRLPDLLILDGFELGRRDLAFLQLLARVFQRGRPQQAADVVGSERRFHALHRFLQDFPGAAC